MSGTPHSEQGNYTQHSVKGGAYKMWGYDGGDDLKYWKTIINIYRGADKSLARPDWKNNWKIAIFRPTRRSLLPRRPGWTDNHLNCFWVSLKSGTARTLEARPAVFQISCYCVVLSLFVMFCCYCVVPLLFVLFCYYLCCSMYCLCINVYCTTATGCLPNCS